MIGSSSLLLLLLLAVSVQTQLSIRWNGTDITDRMDIIYHDELLATADDEISDPDEPGSLICSSTSRARVDWLGVTDSFGSVSTGNEGPFKQTLSMEIPSLSRLSRVPNPNVSTTPDTDINGLWSCSIPGERLFIGLYSRGKGVIVFGSLTLESSSFLSDPPTFTLVATTSGGPLRTHAWDRDGIFNEGEEIFGLTSETEQNRINAGYTSRLVVTGYLPGVFRYGFINRASRFLRHETFAIEGGSPTNLTALQDRLNAVQLSWTSPSVTPNGGYRVTAEPGGIEVTAQSQPFRVDIQQPGVYNFQVVYISQHLPGGTVTLNGVTVRGDLPPSLTMTLLSSTSAMVSWTQPPFSFTPDNYTVTLTRVLGTGDLEVEVTDRAPVTTADTSLEFTDLETSSVYTVTVAATFFEFGEAAIVPSSIRFITLQADTNVKNITLSVVVTFVLTLAIYTTVLLLICVIHRKCHFQTRYTDVLPSRKFARRTPLNNNTLGISLETNDAYSTSYNIADPIYAEPNSNLYYNTGNIELHS